MQQWNSPMEDTNNPDELARLRRIYRLIESERKAYHRDTTVTLLKQKAIIRKLEHEKEEILIKINLDHNVALEKKYETAAQKLHVVYKEKKFQMHSLRDKIEQQKRQMNTLDREVRKLKFENNDLNAYHKMQQISQKIRSLEDRLENAFGRYNRLSHKMSRQRDEISHLVYQRNTHKNIWQHLNGSLEDSRRKVEDLMTTATDNYNKREELYQKFQAIKVSQRQDRKLCKAQLQEAERTLSNQTQMSAFMAVKNKRRLVTADDVEGAILPHLGQFVPTSHSRGTNSNFELFNFGCNLCSKYETLHAEVCKLREDLETMRETDSISVLRSESGFKEVEYQTAVMAAEATDAEKHVNQVKRVLPSLKSGLEAMISAVGGDPQALAALEPDSEDLTSKSLLTETLQDIESRVNKLLQTKLFFDSQTKEKEASLQLHTASGNVGLVQAFQPVRSAKDIEMLYINIPKFDDSLEIVISPRSRSQADVLPLTMDSLKGRDQSINFEHLPLL